MFKYQEIARRAWNRGATDAIFAQAYGGLAYDEDGDVIPPDGILSGEWAGESISELIPEADDAFDYACDAYESAYSDAYVALAEWADTDEADTDAPTNPYDGD